MQSAFVFVIQILCNISLAAQMYTYGMYTCEIIVIKRRCCRLTFMHE